jgi:starvation-inducible DNA-binding protein
MAVHTIGDTHIDLAMTARQAVCELLNQTLADLFDLYSQTKQAHWTVRGPNFWQLHKMFDEIATAVEAHIDEVAERIATLGGFPRGTVRMASNGSQLPEFPETFEDLKHVTTLIERFSIVADTVRQNIDKSDELSDKTTADLFTEISRSIDQQLWFLEAHTPRKE